MSRRTINVGPCSVEHCKKPAEKRGWCGMHYRRWQRHGDVQATARFFLTLANPDAVIDHLQRLKVVDPTTGCWLWTGYGGTARYGHLTIDGKVYATHRVSAHLFLGLDLVGELNVLHRCDVTRCYNPEHLFVGTQQENVLDMFAKGRANTPRGERVITAKLTEKDVRLIRMLHAEGRSFLSLAKEFGVSDPMIGLICKRRSWKHVD